MNNSLVNSIDVLLRISKKTIVKTIECVFFLFSYFIPARKGLLVFSMSRGKYWGNSRALFEHMAQNKNFSIAWLYDSSLSLNEIPDRYHTLFLPRYSFKGWYTCARAHGIIISHGFGDFELFRKIAKHKKTIILWHAITTKNCGLLDEKYNSSEKKNYLNTETKFYDFLTVSSDIDRYYSASYTGIDVNKIVVTGLPRNDQLFYHKSRKIEKNETLTFLYAPTFRDYKIQNGSVFFPFTENESEISEWADKIGVRFYLRPHPNDKESVVHVELLSQKYPKIYVDSGFKNESDIMRLIIRCDGIITDYSSIYIDGLALDLPAIFVNYDQAEYEDKRGLAYDYDLITPGPKVQSFTEFKVACEEMINGACSWSTHREYVRKIFFKYRDANACSRVEKHIQKMLLEQR